MTYREQLITACKAKAKAEGRLLVSMEVVDLAVGVHELVGGGDCGHCGGSGVLAEPNKWGEPHNERQCDQCEGTGKYTPYALTPPPKPPRKHTSQKAAPNATLTDAEWVASLEAEPHLSGVNIKREINACQFWCKNNKKLPTRRRILNWLAKAERVVDLKASGAQHATGLKVPPAPGPEGWLAWVADNIPPEDDAAWGQVTAAYNCQQFSMLPQSWQARCRGAIA